MYLCWKSHKSFLKTNDALCRNVWQLTVKAYKEDRKNFSAEGMDDYLSKPICIDALFDYAGKVVGHWLHIKRCFP